MEKEKFLKFVKDSKDAVIVNLGNCFGQENNLMVELFQTEKSPMEDQRFKGSITKMGNINFVGFNKKSLMIATSAHNTVIEDLIYIINAYYAYQPNEGDNNAFNLCKTKVEASFAGKNIFTMHNDKLYKGFSIQTEDLIE
jgi:hypothetical protein